MIGLSMVTPPGPDFGAETDHGIVLVFEGFQAFPALQNLTADGWYPSHGVTESLRSISIFIFMNQPLVSAEFSVRISMDYNAKYNEITLSFNWVVEN